MENEKTIHNFNFNLICEYFLSLERQGPGSPESTLKALSFIEGLNDDSQIADLGCGTGGQTIVLAGHTRGHITALDLFADFIGRLNENAQKEGLHGRITGIVGSMDDLPFQNEQLDLIWCEGAIYNIGFKRGIEEWRRYLKKGGYLALTEACWFTENPPQEIEEFWHSAYSEIDTVANKIAQLQSAGYSFVAAFALPENCWTDHYYAQHIPAQASFLEKYAGNKTAEDFVACQQRESILYNKYKEHYGYVFFIAAKS